MTIPLQTFQDFKVLIDDAQKDRELVTLSHDLRYCGFEEREQLQLENLIACKLVALENQINL